MLLLALWACAPASVDTQEPSAPSACDCADPTTLPFAATVVGGFDDWAGNAVVWAIDPARE